MDPRAGCSPRFGPGARCQECRSTFQSLPYDQAQRPGYGVGHQPFDHHSSWGSALGDAKYAARRHLSIRAADSRGADFMTETEAVVFIVDDDAPMRESVVVSCTKAK